MPLRGAQEASHAFAAQVFSNKLETEGAATSQRASGRCWMFAALNIMRQPMMVERKLPKDFQLSQTFLYFYDKLERANFFLENILSTLDEPLEGRLVAHLLSEPVNDGGQWDMFVAPASRELPPLTRAIPLATAGS